MKRLSLIITLAALLSLPAGFASAAEFWKFQAATPASTINKKTFNLQYTVLATDETSFVVALYQGTTQLDSQTTNSDPNTVNGNSGAFPITVPTDGTYTYRMVATNTADNSTQEAIRTVSVDTQAPASPAFGGVVRSGNNYTITFTAPGGDVKYVEIYAATSTSFTADDATRVARLTVTPGQQITYTYSAPDADQRYFALRSFDGAGNGSTFASDNNAAPREAEQSAADDNGTASGTVNANGENKTKDEAKNNDNSKDDVLGTSDNSRTLWWLLLAFAAVVGLYYWIFVRGKRSALLSRETTENKTEDAAQAEEEPKAETKPATTAPVRKKSTTTKTNKKKKR